MSTASTATTHLPLTLGRLLMTPAARDALSPEEMLASLRRHAAGDWGDICSDDAQVNHDALQWGGRIFSAYNLCGGRLWIITEHDRSCTTLLLPSDY